MNMISELRQRVRQSGKAEITAAEYDRLQAEWIIRAEIDPDESLRQQLADNDLFELDRNKWRNNYRRELAKLTEQVTLLRDVLKFYMDNGICEPFYHRAAEALAATEPKP